MSFSIVMHLRGVRQAFFGRLGVCIAVLSAARIYSAQDPAAAHVGRGYELIQDGRFQEAESEFRGALELNPSLTRARYQLAICLFALGSRDESEQEFVRVSREAPDNRGARYYLGRLRLLKGDHAGAVRFLAPIAADPPIPDTRFYLGCALLSRGDADAAIKVLEAAVADSPRDYRIPYRLARAYSRIGRQADAAKEYDKAAMLRGAYNSAAEDSLQCTEALTRSGARTACEKLFDPNDPDKLTTLGMIYGKHGNFEDAIRALQLASKLDPDSFEIFHNLGLSYFRLRRYQEARPALERAVSLRPDFFGSNALLGAVLFSLKDDHRAWTVLAHARELEPANEQVNDLLFKVSLLLARDRYQEKDYAGCLEYLHKAAEAKPSDALVHRKLSEVYRITGNSDLAGQELQQAVRLESSAR